MRPIIIVATTTVALSFVLSTTLKADDPGDDFEQIPSCGSVSPTSSLWQTSQGGLRVSGYTQSTRNLDGCASVMRVEAWVEGITMDTAINQGTGMAVSISYAVPVPRFGTWNSTGKHWLINFGMWLWNGYSHGSANVTTGGDDPPPDDPAAYCASLGNDYQWDPNAGLCTNPGPSPILIDTNRDGYRLTSPEDGVYFDINADGIPIKMAWTEPDSDDAWLAFDRNGDGVIDNGTELFGNHTPTYPDNPLLVARNGFIALKFLEGPDFGRSNGDGILSARDAVYGRLLLWRDRNHNGISEPDELEPVANSGLVAISTDYQQDKRRDKWGNEFRQRAKVWWQARGANPSEAYAYDVWLRTAK